MNFEIKGVHYDLSDATKEFIDKKLQRIDFAKNDLIDLMITITKEKKVYRVESNFNFKWGQSAHVGAEGFELYEAIELMLDKLENKVRKEKDKIKTHT